MSLYECVSVCTLTQVGVEYPSGSSTCHHIWSSVCTSDKLSDTQHTHEDTLHARWQLLALLKNWIHAGFYRQTNTHQLSHTHSHSTAVIQAHKQTPLSASQTECFLIGFCGEWTDRRRHAHISVYWDIQADTHTPITASSAVLALANIPALRQRLFCLSAPASCDLCVCVCTSVCVSIGLWQKRLKSVNSFCPVLFLFCWTYARL